MSLADRRIHHRRTADEIALAPNGIAGRTKALRCIACCSASNWCTVGLVAGSFEDAVQALPDLVANMEEELHTKRLKALADG